MSDGAIAIICVIAFVVIIAILSGVDIKSNPSNPYDWGDDD